MADHPRAARVPSEISVSMLAARWRRPAHAARWKGQPPHSTTGAASARAAHSQPPNRRAGIIDTSSTGSESAAETARRRPSPPSPSLGRLAGPGRRAR